MRLAAILGTEVPVDRRAVECRGKCDEGQKRKMRLEGAFLLAVLAEGAGFEPAVGY